MRNEHIITALLLLLFFVCGCSLKYTMEDHDKTMEQVIDVLKTKKIGGIAGETGKAGAISFQLDLKERELIIFHPITGLARKIDLDSQTNWEYADYFPKELFRFADELIFEDFRATDWGDTVFYSYIRAGQELFRMEFEDGRPSEITAFLGRYLKNIAIDYPQESICRLSEEDGFWIKILEIY